MHASESLREQSRRFPGWLSMSERTKRIDFLFSPSFHKRIMLDELPSVSTNGELPARGTSLRPPAAHRTIGTLGQGGTNKGVPRSLSLRPRDRTCRLGHFGKSEQGHEISPLSLVLPAVEPSSALACWTSPMRASQREYPGLITDFRRSEDAGVLRLTDDWLSSTRSTFSLPSWTIPLSSVG